MTFEEFGEKYPFAQLVLKMGIDLLIDIAAETDGHYTQCKVTKKTGETWTITVQEITENLDKNDNQ